VNHAQGAGRSSLDDPSVITEKPVRIEAAGLDLPDFRPVDDKKANWWARGKRWLISPALFKLCDTGDEVHVVLLYERNPTYYVVNYMFLNFAITSCAAFGWSIEYSNVEGRLSFDGGLLLTAVAFKQVLATIVPPISYLTRLDVYAMLSLAYLLLATVMHAALGFIIADCDADGDCTFNLSGFGPADAVHVDRVFLYTYIGTWIFSNLFYGYGVNQRRWKQRANYSPEHAKEKGYQKAQVIMAPPEWYEQEGGSGGGDASVMAATPTPSNGRASVERDDGTLLGARL